MEFILNEDYGINGIKEISFQKIFEVFREPCRREIVKEEGFNSLNINCV